MLKRLSLSLLALCTLQLAFSESSAEAQSKPSASSPDSVHHYRAQVMGTVVDISLWTDQSESAAKAAEQAFEEFRRVDALMSSWLEDSAVAQINRNAGKKGVQVNSELFGLIERAQKSSKSTAGAFDISVGAFRGLWKFDQDIDGSIPEKTEVDKRRRLVNFRKVQLKKNKAGGKVKLAKEGMRITLGGIAKGYAVDQAVAILHKAGFADFIIQAGGDLYASGQKGDRKWRVGIRDPRGQRNASFAVMEISNSTFSTSGDYERSVVKDGVRYHHLLDPKTGSPAKESRSVTVMAKDAITADIWSTSLFILGHEKGMKIVEGSPELEAVFVDAKNALHISSGLKGKLIVLRPPSPGV